MVLPNKGQFARAGKRRAKRLERHSRPPWERMVHLHRLIQERRYPNCRGLSEALEVSSKTVQRDIDFMRDRLGLPIEYNQLKLGFYYTQPVSEFPGMEMSEGELVALLIAQKALSQHSGTPFERPLRNACRKLAHALGDKITVDWAALDAAISFRAAGVGQPDLELFDAVSRAVLQSAEITFQYLKLRSSQHEFRTVQPYHLGCVENQWYLFAHDLGRGQLRTFALTRMHTIRMTGRKFRRPAGFSIAQHLSQSFGVFARAGGGGRHKVRIHFDHFAARLVTERTWHESQRITQSARGEIELHLVLGDLEEIEPWILSWGEHARVLGPKRLANSIRRIAAKMAAA